MKAPMIDDHEMNLDPIAHSALNTQTGGNHYKHFVIQPIEFTMKNGLGFIEGNIIKYVSRHKLKNGAEDIQKVKHYAELLLELEYGIKPSNELEAAVNAVATVEELSASNLVKTVLNHNKPDLILKAILHQMLFIDWEATQETINETVTHHPCANASETVLLDIRLLSDDK